MYLTDALKISEVERALDGDDIINASAILPFHNDRYHSYLLENFPRKVKYILAHSTVETEFRVVWADRTPVRRRDFKFEYVEADWPLLQREDWEPV